MSAETVRAINLADRLGLPQAGLCTSVSEVVADVRARFDGHRLDNETIDQLRAERDEAWQMRNQWNHRAITAEAERDRYRAIVDVALNISDSNYCRLEKSLRKSGWIAGADEVQVLRKTLAAIHTDRGGAW